MTQEERITKLESSNALLVKEKSAIGTTVKQKEREIADLTRQNSTIKTNLEKSEKLNQSQLEKIAASKAALKRVEELEKMIARGVAIQEKMHETIESSAKNLEASLKSKAELSQEKLAALKKNEDWEKLNAKGVAIQKEMQASIDQSTEKLKAGLKIKEELGRDKDAALKRVEDLETMIACGAASQEKMQESIASFTEKLDSSLKCNEELSMEFSVIKSEKEKSENELKLVLARVGEYEVLVIKYAEVEATHTALISDLNRRIDEVSTETSAVSAILAETESTRTDELSSLKIAHSLQISEFTRSSEIIETDKQLLIDNLASKESDLSASVEKIEILKSDYLATVSGIENAHCLVLGDFNERVSSLESEKESLSESLELINGELSSEKSTLISLQEEIGVLKRDLGASLDTSSSLRECMGEMKQTHIDSLAVMTSEYEDSLGKMGQTIADVNMAREELKECNCDMIKNLDTSKTELESCKADLNASRLSFEEFVASSDIAKSSLVDSFNMKMQGSEETVGRMEKQIEQLSENHQTTVAEYQGRIIVEKEKVAMLEGTIEDLESDLNDNSKVIAEISGELEAKNKAIDSLDSAQESIKLMLASATEEAEEFAKEANERDENHKSQIFDFESCVEDLKGAGAHLEMEKEGLVGELSILQIEIKNLEMCAEENVIALKEGSDLRLKYEEEICDKKGEIEVLNARCGENDESIKSLEVEISDLTLSSSTKVTDLEDVLASIKCAFESKIEEHVNSNQSHLLTIEALKGDVVGLNSEICRLAKDGDELKSNLVDSQTRNSQLEGVVETLESSVVVFETDIIHMAEDGKELRANLEGAQDRITLLVDDVEKFRRDAVGLESELSRTTDVGVELKTTLDAAKSKTLLLEEDVDRLKGDAVALESEISRIGEVGAEIKRNLEESQAEKCQLEADVEERTSLLFEAAQKKQALANEIVDLEGKLVSVEGVYADTLAGFESFKISTEARIAELDENLLSESVRYEATLSTVISDNVAALADIESHHADNLVSMQAAVDRVSVSLKEKTKESDLQAEKIGSLSRDIGELKFVYNSKSKDWEAEKASLDSHVSQIESLNSEIESNVADLTMSLEEASTRLSITAKNLVETELANKEVNSRLMESQNETTKILSSRKDERKISDDLRQVNLSLTEENTLLLQNHVEEINISKAEIDKLSVEKESLQKLLSISENNLVQAGLKLEMLESLNADLEQMRNDELKKAVEDMTVEREGHQEQISSMHERVLDLTSRSQTSQVQLEKVHAEKARMETMIQMLELKNATQVSGKETQIRSLEEQIANTAGMLEGQKEEIANLLFIKHENKSMLYDLDMIKSENAVLERKVHDILANDQHDRRSMRSQLETRLAEINILKSERDRLKKDINEGEKKSQKLLDKAHHEVKLAKAKEDFVTNELLKASEEQSGQVGHNNAKQKIKLFSQLKEDNVRMKKEIEASKLSQDDSRRKMGKMEREVESLKALQGTGGKVMSKAQRTFRERQVVALGQGEEKEN